MKKIMQKATARILRNRVAENVNGTAYRRHCLIVYVVAPFLSNRVSVGHQNQWQAKELARIVGEFGYNVDVINFDNQQARLTRRYDLIIDAHPGLTTVYKQQMAAACIRIAYMTGSNPDFSNAEELKRIKALSLRRGKLIKPRRHVKSIAKLDLESCDAMFFIGSAYNYQTYSDYNIKRLYYIKNNGINFQSVPGSTKRLPYNFLFLASGGQVHKGLDLLLEAFALNPKINLYVCSSFQTERDFCDIYKRELFHLNNVKPIGFVDVMSAEFRKIAEVCTYSVLPSCSEANASSVLTAMSAGLIPIISRESGFEDDEARYFPDCSVETIAATLNEYATKSQDWIVVERERLLAIVNSRYSESKFTLSVQVALTELFNDLSLIKHNNE